MIRSLQAIVILFLFAINGSIYAQTTIQSPNIPVAGDVWGNKTISDTTIQPGLGGTNQVWNFGTFFVNPSVISEEYAVPSGSGNDGLFPSANLKATSLFGGEDYYYRTTTELQYLGYKSQSMEVVISNTQKILVAPLAYGDSIVNSPVTGTGIFGYPLSGTVSVKADGIGNLTLYTGSFPNTLRLVTTMNLVIGAGSGNDTYVNITKYTWYSSIYRAPVFQIATINVNGNLANVNQKVVTVSLLTTDVSSVSNDINFSISPNPAHSSANISFDLAASATQILLMDLAGKVQRKYIIPAGIRSDDIDLSELAKGVYIVSVTQNNMTQRSRLVVE